MILIFFRIKFNIKNTFLIKILNKNNFGFKITKYIVKYIIKKEININRSIKI